MKFNSFEQLGEIKKEFKASDESENISDKEGGNYENVQIDLIIELENETSEKIRDWSSSFFQDIYNNKTKLDIHFRSRGSMIEDAILDLVENEETEKDDKLFNSRRKMGMGIFIETMISFVEEKANNINEKNKLDLFINNIQEKMFSFSPNIFNSINLEDMVILSAKANRVPEIQGWFGQTMVGEVVYELNWSPDNIEEKIANKILKLNIAEIFDVLEQLETIGAHACGEMYDASQAFEKVIKIIKLVDKNKRSPLVDYITSLIFERLKIESNSPSLGFITYRGNKEHSRIGKRYSEIMRRQHWTLARQLDPDIKIKGILLPVASDAVADFEQGLTPRNFGLKSEKLPAPQKISIVALRNSIDTLNLKDLTPKEFIQTIDFINNEILYPLGREGIEKNINTQEIINLLLEIESEITKKLIPVHFENYNSIPFDKKLNPLTKDQDEKITLLLQHLHKPALSEKIEDDLGINLLEIPLGSQIHFLRFLANQNKNGFNRLRDILQKDISFKNEFLISFLSTSDNVDMGEKILVLGEKLPNKIAQQVFKKYREIIDNISKITEFTRTNFTKEIETNPELIKKIEEALYIKGKQLLSQTYEDISNKKEINYEDISKQLERINADTITTFAIFKQVIKNGEKLPIESIEGSVFSKKEATDIPDDKQNEMLELYQSNWKNHPDREFVKSLKSYFKTAFAPEENKQKNYLYTFEKDNNIRAFVRFEKQNDKSFYASALNVDEASKNFGLGEAMMDEALTREAKEHILHASCRKDNPSNMRYFEKGFISKGFKKTNETEEFDLVWDEVKNKDIKAKQKTQEELISMQNTNEIEIRKSKDLESLHNNIPEGKSLVRCFINDGEWYAVYEVVTEDYGMNLGETK